MQTPRDVLNSPGGVVSMKVAQPVTGTYLSVLNMEMSLFQRVAFHCIQRCPSFQGVKIEEFHCIQSCPRFRGLE